MRRLTFVLVLVVVAGLMTGGLVACSGGGGGGMVLQARAFDGSNVGLPNYRHANLRFGLAAPSRGSEHVLECSAEFRVNPSDSSVTEASRIQVPAVPKNGEGMYPPIAYFDDDNDLKLDIGEPYFYWYMNNFHWLEYSNATGWKLVNASPSPGMSVDDIEIVVFDSDVTPRK